MGSGKRGGREMKDMLLWLPWLWRPVSLESKGDSGVCPTGGDFLAAVAAVEAAFGFGTSTGLLGSASAADCWRTGARLYSKGLDTAPATPEPDLVEPTGEAAREVMGRAEEFVMSVEPWAWASEAWAGATALWLCTEMGALVLVLRECEPDPEPEEEATAVAEEAVPDAEEADWFLGEFEVEVEARGVL